MSESRLLDAVVTALAALPPHARIAVAYSGGLDSTVLLDLSRRVAMTRQLDLLALHVNHGLQPSADDWQQFCAQQAQSMGIQFHSRKVKVEIEGGHGIEAAARQARYAALNQWSKQFDIDALLLAHHQDDQAETLLINLMRGSGAAGLAAMAADGSPPWRRNALPSDATPPNFRRLRPLLNLPQNLLLDYAQRHQLAYIQDPSNADTRLRRNAVRHQLLPALRRIEPNATANLARSARHLAEAQQLLDTLGLADIAPLVDMQRALLHNSLEIAPLLTLGEARVRNALRVWLRRLGLRAPSETRLAALLQQLQDSSRDSQLLWKHDGYAFHAWRGRLWIDPDEAVEVPLSSGRNPSQSFLLWQGQSNWALPEWRGTLHFIPTEDTGVDTVSESALRNALIAVRARQGGERLRLAFNRPSRPLKQAYQDAGIPAWRRAGPLFWIMDRLLMVPGLGVDAQWRINQFGGSSRRLIWEQTTAC